MKHERKIVKKIINGRQYTWTIFEKEKKVSCRIVCGPERMVSDIRKIFNNNVSINYLGLKITDVFIHAGFNFCPCEVTVCNAEDVFDENVGMRISRIKAERKLHNVMMQALDSFINDFTGYHKELFRLKVNYKKKYKKASKKNAQ